MAWIKRNLLFSIGGIIALLLLGGAAFYNYGGWRHNATAFEKLNEIYGQLQQLGSQKPGPGDAKVNNTQTAKEQELEIRKWVEQAVTNFKPIAAIPSTPEVTSDAFAAALRRTIDLLQRQGEAASVQLPPKYGFSFEAQRSLVRFAPGSLAPLAVQMGEVKAMVEILYAARVNSIDGIQRVRVSEDDIAGLQSDYVAEVAITSEVAVLTPYTITFRSFTPELAAVLAGFAASPNGFIVKGVNVAPAGLAVSSGYAGGGYPGAYGRGEGGFPGEFAPPPVAPPAGTAIGKGGMAAFLNEQLLRVTLEVVIVKPLPKQ